MVRIGVVLLLLAAGAMVAASVLAHRSEAAPAAAIQRTFVSTSGNDANPCTRTAPCRNFQAALANTLDGGEVVALDSGGYGSVIVDKAVTIAGAPGEHVAITAFSGTAVHVNAGDTDTVVLRNLYLTGIGGVLGVDFEAGRALIVESVVASGFTNHGLNAIAAGGHLIVKDSSFRRNLGNGISVAGVVHVEVDHSRADRNGATGMQFAAGANGSITGSAASQNANGTGFLFNLNTTFALSDSVADRNNASGVTTAGSGIALTVSRVVSTNNGAAGLTVATGLARISGSTVSGNATGLDNAGGTLETFGDNLVRGNTTNTSGTITTVSKT